MKVAPSMPLIVTDPSLVRASDPSGDVKPVASSMWTVSSDVGSGAAVSGLVICAISSPVDVSSLVGLQFPSADMLGAAAAMWPRFDRPGLVYRWHEGGTVCGPVQAREYSDASEGAVTWVDIAPGLVRVRRNDGSRVERAEQGRVDAGLEAFRRRRDDAARDAAALLVPMVFAEFCTVWDDTPARRDVISAWSAKSRARMISTICELDLAPLVSGAQIPCMVTLTLPGDWVAVAPDAVAAQKCFQRLAKAYEKRWHAPLVCIWKREFQRRGAPHWHLWLVPPGGAEFRAWLSVAWTTALFGRDAVRVVASHTAVDRPRCACCEVCRSLGAGTGVDFADGLRARDPKRLAIYFLKESLGGEGKAYQNGAPDEWAGQSVGRFWGYRGIARALVSVPVAGAVDVQVARVLRRWQRAQRVTREVEVWGVRERDTVKRAALRASGEVTVRRLRRRARVIGSAGWVACNSGAELGAALGRWATIVQGRAAYTVDVLRQLEALGVPLGSVPRLRTVVVPRPSWAAEGPVEQSGRWPAVV